MKPIFPPLLAVFPALRGPLITLSVLGVLGGIATIAQALTLGWLVTAIVAKQPWAPPAQAVLIAFLCRAALAGLIEYAAASAAATASTSLRRALLHACLLRPAGWTPPSSDSAASDSTVPVAAKNPPEAVGGAGSEVDASALIQGATSVEPYFSRYLPTLLSAAVVPVGVVLCMAILDPLTALIPLLTLPLLPLFAALIGMATRDATATRWKALASLSGHFLDVMKGLPTLVNYGRAERQTTAIAETSFRHRDATIATLKLAFLSSAALELLATISVAIVAVAVGIRLAAGSMELWPALPLILLAPEAYWPIRRVGAEFHNAADGAAALEAALPHLTAHPIPTTHSDHAETVNGATPEKHRGQGSATAPRRVVAMVADLSYRYHPETPWVFDHFSHAFTSGLNVISGPSGVGKSTLLDLLAGLRLPEKGRVEAPRTHTLAQRPFLIPGSIEDNLTLGAENPSPERLQEVLEQVQLTQDIAHLPAGLATALGEDGFGLSAGQRARLALARALLSDAPLLLCDEPTAHLDPESIDAVVAALTEASACRTVVVVTHQPDVFPPSAAHLQLTASPHPAAQSGGVAR